MNFDKQHSILDRIKKDLGTDFIIAEVSDERQPYIETSRDKLFSLCSFLKNSEGLYFDFLNCISGIDNGPEEGTMEVWYHLSSLPMEHSLVIKVDLERNSSHSPLPCIPSVVSLWKTADWHERETYDLLGIEFTNHPDLRRILLPADWQGHPLRKDYDSDGDYHGIHIKYDR